VARLTRSAIVEAAFAQLAEGGLTSITARRLAERLGVQAGALYYHLPDMAALQDEMATVIVQELNDAPVVDLPWDDFLRASAAHVRRVLLSYRDGAAIFSGTYLTDDAALGSMEAPLRTLTSAGFTLADAVRALQTLAAFVTGYVIEEQHRLGAPERYTAALRHARIDASVYPLSDAASEVFLDDTFDWGVDALVAGIAVRLSVPPPAATST